ncbi:receptor-like protein EIX2 [Lolium rigidum]|uniref:receptor-like protein EIX2 n=1 Tax=Lolium rigidum TaxID=89674 RepID=UPI001F5CC534|nr:receptor-like protein EIX2 [Lolium rigidum]
MDMLQLISCIHITIALLLFTQAKSYTEAPKETTTGCIADERIALLALRAGLSDPSNLLSSWNGGDCCRWKGVRCSNSTGHVVELDLHSPDCSNNFGSKLVLGGIISSSLVDLHHLQHLNLSCNDFGGAQIPEFFGSLRHLEHLDLSMSYFSGMIPPQLGNLSNLRYFILDSIDSSNYIYSTDITWLSRLSCLEHLDMSGVNLSAIQNWVPVVNMLPSLKFLRLFRCQLNSSPDSILHLNLTSIETLDISVNQFRKPITPNWFWELTSLRHLDISHNEFSGPFPNEIGNMTSVVKIDLSFNNLGGMIPSNMQNLCNLEELLLGFNNIGGSITELFHRLPRCSWNKLRTLCLPYCNLTGSMPTMLEPPRNLTSLDLSINKLIGVVPLWIGNLTKLTSLNLVVNSLHGVIHDGHLSGLLRLEKLFLGYNSIAIIVNSTWVPPFSLTGADLGSCLLGPKFPMWLRYQRSLIDLDISNTSISDMVPDWFWITFSSVNSLYSSNNRLSGFLPSTMEFMRATHMDLSSNNFTGPIPKLPTNLLYLDLSKNNLCGPLPLYFGALRLRSLALFDNSISGVIPSSFCKLIDLHFIDISRNNLSGSIPDCSLNTSAAANVRPLSVLNLRDNNLSGEFPSLLQNFQQLVFLDLTNNQFFGELPAWVGNKLTSLQFLRLRNNMFSGHIPVELTKLVNLQYLDLSYNTLSGSVPRSIVNFTGMMLVRNDSIVRQYFESGANYTVVTKGQERFYAEEIIYMVNLDLSCNNLMGDIPEEIGSLVALKNLNLSRNTLGGKIPENIGALMQVESLDLSHNGLSGEIPLSLSDLTSLSRLNLSYNNLTGRIPSGNQLQTLEDPEYIYVGNPGLCGPPLARKCSQPEPIPATREHYDDISDAVSFFQAMGSGCIMGIWIVFCTFLFKRKWRVSWFSLCDSWYGWAYVQVALTWPSWTRVNG